MKKKSWTTTKMIATGTICILNLLTRIIVYSTLLTLTGSVFAGISSLIYGAFFLVLVALINNQFGTVTLYSFLNVIVGLPTPGLFPKIANLILGPTYGLIIDYINLKMKTKLLFSIFAGFTINLFWVLQTIFFFFFISLPGTKNVPEFLITPLGLIIVTLMLSLFGIIPGYFAYFVYKKIENTSIVKRIQK
jgi:hypothetical protein